MPGQLLSVGTTLIVAVTGDAVALVAEKAPILPEPLAANPILVVLLVQAKLAPAVPLNATAAVDVPAQTVWLAGSVTVGNGLTTISNV